jgi:hypothetical protein
MVQNLIAINFRNRFQTAYHNSHYTSYSHLSREAGLSRPVTQKILGGQFDHSMVGPGIFSLKRLANALETNVGHLLSEDIATEPRTQAFFSGTGRKKSTMEKLMETHWRGAGRLEAFEQLVEDCDSYEVPHEDTKIPKILSVGKRTLFAGRLGGPFTFDAQSEINAFGTDKHEDMLNFFRRVAKEGTAIGNSFLAHSLVTRPARVSTPNVRLGLLTEDAVGRRSILIHAIPIPA